MISTASQKHHLHHLHLDMWRFLCRVLCFTQQAIVYCHNPEERQSLKILASPPSTYPKFPAVKGWDGTMDQSLICQCKLIKRLGIINNINMPRSVIKITEIKWTTTRLLVAVEKQVIIIKKELKLWKVHYSFINRFIYIYLWHQCELIPLQFKNKGEEEILNLIKILQVTAKYFPRVEFKRV